VYNGRVVNITKFGAFVNILPGRDGLVHISKLGGGKRINAVEDVLSLGQEIEVRVDEIDDKGKVSLSPAGDPPASNGAEGSSDGGERAPRPERSERSDRPERSEAPAATATGEPVVSVSFEEAFDAELADELGDLGPDSPRASAGTGDSRGGRNGGGRDAGSRDRGRRRHR
ncbi:MAG: S1 RNA-binding domain-containing protein, partial [Ilumatobacteraceae bacterium]